MRNTGFWFGLIAAVVVFPTLLHTAWADAPDGLNLPVVEQDQAPLSPELAALRSKVRTCLDYYYEYPVNTAAHCPWEILHMAIGFGVDAKLRIGGPQGKPVSAIGWLCYNRPCRGLQLFKLHNDMPQPRIGVGLQGHHGQFLSALALSRVGRDYPIRVAGREFTVDDLIEHEQLTCRPRSELTFKLISFVHYLPSDATWTSDTGQAWDIPRMIKEEIAQPIVGGTCGGTHRIMGLNYAVRKRQQRGEPVTGQWLRAKDYVDKYQNYAFGLLNPNGSMSTNWFRGRNSSGSVDRSMETTGHTLEWLVFSLPDEQLRDPRVIRSVNYLADLLYNYRGRRWNIGPLGHAIHTLVLYDQRVFGAQPGERNARERQAEAPTDHAASEA